MQAKKRRSKNRRRARRLAEQAWEALDDDHPDLARKLIRRATETEPGNPNLWIDRGRLHLDVDEAAAAEAFQAAISLAPDYAEAFACLAEIRARQGNFDAAVQLQQQAVRHDENSHRYRQSLAAYEALANQSRPRSPSQPAANEFADPPDDVQDLASRVDGLDWDALEGDLTKRGFALVRQFLPVDRCREFVDMFSDESQFSKTVTMNKSRFGEGVYRYFTPPVPPAIEGLRHLFFPRVAAIANRWRMLLGDEPIYPQTWEQFRSRCAAAGQTSPTPLLLRYEAGGFNAPHQDIRGEIFFPLQLVIVLSRRFDSTTDDKCRDGFRGGEFLFCDTPERKSADRKKIPAGLGDAVLFCTRARPMPIANTFGLKSVKHGLDRVTAGVRYAMAIPFHEYE
jgi:hypothetical protein